jgi:hypothetical protein
MFTNEEAQKIAEEIYQSWKAGDTASDRWNWFMVKMDKEIQDLCAKRLQREISL